MKTYVNYEDFGAVGDGIADDMDAICAAHEYANRNRLPVRTNDKAEYCIGGRAKTAVIETDTDWGNSRFVIDDRKVENNKLPCFLVRSTLQEVEISIQKLHRDQKSLGFSLPRACYVVVENSQEKKFIRFGLNQSKGVDTTDCFIVEADGEIASPIDWEYDTITSVRAYPSDEEQLTIRGGIFTTIANRDASVYNYYSRGIDVARSNTLVDGISHYVVEEKEQGSPYRGFISAMWCANVIIQNCFVTGHKIYTTIGAAGLPVQMGSYDLHANNVVNLSIIHCRMNHILDRTRWGVMASNYCKNIKVENCVLSRLDAHMGVSGFYRINHCELGHAGLNAIGRGKLVIANSTLHGESLVCFREDYGSTWEGEVLVKDSRWNLHDTGRMHSCLFSVSNTGTHDFGYPCYMPEKVIIENLYVDDEEMSEDHSIYIFSDPDALEPTSSGNKNKPYPYAPNKSVRIQGLEIKSKAQYQMSFKAK